MVFSLVWANIIPNHEAIVSSVVFGDDTVTGSAVVAMGMGIGTIPFFMHAEPVLVLHILQSKIVAHLVPPTCTNACTCGTTRCAADQMHIWVRPTYPMLYS